MTELELLYRQAAEETEKGSKSFYFATRFFSPDLAAAAHAVYWFCRYTDNLVDECADQEQGTRDLEAWRQALTSASRSGATVKHPVLRVFLDTAARYEIPLVYAFELLEGMRMDLKMDLTHTAYRNFDELRLFCYRVASVVGLMMCWVIGFEHPDTINQAIPRAIDLGIAMQLTNILRDVGEDLERGRIYLPLDELERFGYSERELRAHVRNQAFKDLMKFQVQRARSYYLQGNQGIRLLNPQGRFAVKVASDVYCEILRQVEASGFDVFNHRAVVPSVQRFWLTARNMTGPLARNSAEKLAFWRRP